MMPRFDNRKIAIIGAVECQEQFSEPQIKWFENDAGVNCEKFDFVLDASQAGLVTLIADDEKMLIHDANDEISSLLKSLISVLLDMKIMDIDFSDIKSVIGKECIFKSLSASEDDVKNNIESWIKENLKECSNSLFVHLQFRELCYLDMSDFLSRIAHIIDNSIELTEDEDGILYTSISGEVYKDADIKISFWYR